MRPSGSRKPVSPEALEGDMVLPGDPRYGVIWINPERMSGVPCFYGTRVPIQNLFDYLGTGESLDSFLDDFPGVTREQAVTVLDMARDRLDARGHAA